jgi:hypothetical protein
MDDNGDPINNDLHQELDFKNPNDKDAEEKWDTIAMVNNKKTYI